MRGNFLVKRKDDGRYVSGPGVVYSYTSDIKRARIFKSKEEAERDCCGNETVVDILDELEIR